MYHPLKQKPATPKAILLVFVCLLVLVWVRPASAIFPFEEDFEGTDPVFDVAAGSGWGIVSSHGPWATFRGERHLDNNIAGADQQRSNDRRGDYRVIMNQKVTIPEEGSDPVLSFWYKAQLGIREDNGNGNHNKCEQLKKPKRERHRNSSRDVIYIDVHSVKKVGKHKREQIDTIKAFTPRENTDEFYQWEKISLGRYRGEEIQVSFRQTIDPAGPARLFVVDDFRISDLPRVDADNDGIPDPYDPSPNGEMLPMVSGLSVRMGDDMEVLLEWPVLEDQPLLAGFRVYRTEIGTDEEILLNPDGLISSDEMQYKDTCIQNATQYQYRVVAVSIEGKEGEDAGSVSMDVAYNLTPFPYEESFDSVAPLFTVPEDSGYAVSKAHGSWDGVSGLWHLDSNPDEAAQSGGFGSLQTDRALMTRRVHIPDNAQNPILSFWYRLGLTDWTGLIMMDIHYIDRRDNCAGVERVQRDALVLGRWRNTDQPRWIKVPLRRYRGTEIWVVFRQFIPWDSSAGGFVMDDFRISEQPEMDSNTNSIPDAYETPLNADMLPYPETLAVAASTQTGETILTWAPLETRPGFPALAGYQLYRRTHDDTGPAQKVNTTLIPPDAETCTDISVENDHAYHYVLAAVSVGGMEGYPSREVSAFTAWNDTPAENLTARWINGKATLDWTGVPEVTWQVYRQTGGIPLALIAEPGAPPFEDPTAYYYYGYEFSLASVKEYRDPLENRIVIRVGPQSPSVLLEALEQARVNVEGAEAGADGIYLVRSGAGDSYTLQGTYELLEGAVSVTGTLQDTTVTGSAADNNFSIELTATGVWEITLSETEGWRATTVQYRWEVDNIPPSLSVFGLPERTTSQSSIVITGTAYDPDSPIVNVTAVSDRFSDRRFGAGVDGTGAFTCEVPLRVGDNILTVSAQDVYGNTTSETIEVALVVATLPSLVITSPENGATVHMDRVDVAGLVRSSLPPDQIRLLLGDQLIFPAGDNSEYDFTFEDIPLVPGPNTLTLRAETLYGIVTDQVSVTYAGAIDPEQVVLPEIEVRSPLPSVFLTHDPVVEGLVRSELGIVSVTVNGQPALIGSAGGVEVSFEKALSFPQTGEDVLQIDIVAIDAASRQNTKSYSVRFDNTLPILTLSAPVPDNPPAVNVVIETPYEISGRIVEKNLAGLTLNDRSIRVTPGTDPDTWVFTAGVALPQGVEQALSLAARDFSGNSARIEWFVRLEGGIEIEMISPRDGVSLLSEETALPVTITARITGTADWDTATVSLDGGSPMGMVRAGTTASATATVDADGASHRLEVAVQDSAQATLATRSISFTTTSMADIPLTVERQEPANNAVNVEPNGYLAFYFNKPISPDLLEIQVRESAHGRVYGSRQKGADLTQFSRIELVEVHRDQETVSGGISGFPGNKMAAFYPERDYAYGAEVYVTVLYDGVELSRSTFNVRPLPTFIQGGVVDQFNSAVAGIEVVLPAIFRTSVTDGNGCFSFGHSGPEDAAIEGGRYRAIINPGLKNRAFGSIERWIHVEGGKLNEVGVSTLPVLSTQEPFRRIASGTAQVMLAGEDLVLDLSGADLLFPDGRNQGDVHVQFLSLNEMPYPFMGATVPHWIYNLQPAGMEVSGTVGLTFSMPALYGSHDYVSRIGDLVVLMALDPDALELVPVGVGRVDVVNQKVISVGSVALKRLECLGYAMLGPDRQEAMQRYADGEITLAQMIGELEAGR